MGNKDQKPGKKRPKSYYRKSGKNYSKQDRMLQCGMQGILITCSGDASHCVREAYNLLNEYADKLYGPEDAGEGASENAEEDSDEDISESLQKEVNALNKQHSSKDRRFKNVRTGAKNVVFIQTKGVDPHKIVLSIVTDLEATRTLKARYIQRMLPVSHTCKTLEDRIEQTAREALYPAFHAPGAKDASFCIMFKARNNNQIHKESIVKLLAPLVMQGSSHIHRVDFDAPDLTVMVDVIGPVCCLSVLEEYSRFKKYNLHLVAKGNGPAVEGGKRKRADAEEEVRKDESDSNPAGGKRLRPEDPSSIAKATPDDTSSIAKATPDPEDCRACTETSATSDKLNDRTTSSEDIAGKDGGCERTASDSPEKTVSTEEAAENERDVEGGIQLESSNLGKAS